MFLNNPANKPRDRQTDRPTEPITYNLLSKGKSTKQAFDILLFFEFFLKFYTFYKFSLDNRNKLQFFLCELGLGLG